MLRKNALNNFHFLGNSSTGGHDRIAIVSRVVGGQAIEVCDLDDEWTFVVQICEARVRFRQPSSAAELLNLQVNLAIPTGRWGCARDAPRDERIRVGDTP